MLQITLSEIAMKTDFPPSSSETLASELINLEVNTPDETIWSKLRAEAARERLSIGAGPSLWKHP